MKLTRFRASAAAACAAVALTMGAATPALADGDADTPDAEAIATAAQAAADAANQAFVEADWDEVLAQADVFDGLLGQLSTLVSDGDDALAQARGAVRAAKDVRDGARADVASAQTARDTARDALTALQDQIAEVEELIVDAEADAAGKKSEVPGLSERVAQLQVDLGEAISAQTEAQAAHDAALRTFEGPVPTSNGVALLLEWLDVEAPAYSEVEAQATAAAGEATAAQSAIEVAETAAVTARGAAEMAWNSAMDVNRKHKNSGVCRSAVLVDQHLLWPTSADCRTGAYNNALQDFFAKDNAATEAENAARDAQWDADRAQDRADWWAGVANGAGVAQVRAQVDTATQELADATEAVATIGGPEADGSSSGTLFDARASLVSLEQDIAGLATDIDDWTAELDALRAQLPGAREASRTARDAFDDAKVARDQAVADLEQARAARDELISVNGAIALLVEGLAVAKQDVADRRADLADYRKAESEIVWGTDAAPGVAKPGDVVTVDFTVPGSADYDLSGVTVSVTSPAGLSPECDIADDGVVPAGGSVACTVEYEVQQADVETGSVTFEVVLEGFLPLGPGNPRSTNVTKTKIEASHSLTFDVEALPVIDIVVPEDIDDTPSEPTDEGAEDATDEANEGEVQTDSPAQTTSAVVTESDSDDAEQQTTATEALPTTGGDLGLVLPAGILVALGAALLISRRFLQA